MVLAVGVSHKTAPVDIRERCAFTADTLASTLKDLQVETGAREAFLLSTCNRTEIYTCGVNRETILSWWQSRVPLEPLQLSAHVYHYQQQSAVTHLMRVAAGLDSLVVGEPQILGQIKSAYQLAKEHGLLGRKLNRLCHTTFEVAKCIRTETGIGSLPVSIAYAAVNLAKHLFSHLPDKTALLIGAGDTILLVAQYLKQAGVNNIVIANRTYERALSITERVGGTAILLQDLPAFLHRADILVSATSAPVPIIGKGAMESAIKRRRHRPIFVVDLAVPRDIEPEVSELRDVYLYTVDDLQTIVQDNTAHRIQAAKAAEQMIQEKVQDYMAWLHSEEVFYTIQRFRKEMESVSDTTLQLALKELETGKSPEWVMRRFAYRMTQKLLHTPTIRLRRAGKKKEAEIVRLFQTLLETE